MELPKANKVSQDKLPGIKGQLTSFKKGQSPTQIIGTVDYVFLILEGIVEVYTLSDKGEKFVAILFGKGDIFPISWIIDIVPEGLYFRTKTDCVLLQYSKKDLRRMLSKSHELSQDLLTRVTHQFGFVSQRIIGLQFPYARERLAYRLISLSTKFGVNKGSTIELPYFSQSEIASSINITRESLNRELTRFKKLNLLSYGKNKLVIYDLEGIKHQLTGNIHSLNLVKEKND